MQELCVSWLRMHPNAFWKSVKEKGTPRACSQQSSEKHAEGFEGHETLHLDDLGTVQA